MKAANRVPRRPDGQGRPSGTSYLSHSCSQRSPLDTRTGRPHHRPHTGLRAGRGWRHRHPPLENTQRVGPSCREGLWGREERTAGRRDRGEARSNGQERGMAHLWVGGALRDPPPSFLPPSGSPQPWEFLSLSSLSSKRMAPASSDLPAAQVLWDPPERTLPVSQWIPTKPSGHWQMKALGRSLQEPPFLHGCAWHSSVSAQTRDGTDSYGNLLHVPQDSICSTMISKALSPQCLGTQLWTSAFLLPHPLALPWLGCCPFPAPNILIVASVHAPCSLASQLETAPKLCPSRSWGLCFGTSSPIQARGMQVSPCCILVRPLLPPVMAVPGVKGCDLPIFSAPPPGLTDARPMIFR